ncbi:MAG: hypothetical protein R3A48_14430 [Polyangiales bacterium]
MRRASLTLCLLLAAGASSAQRRAPRDEPLIGYGADAWRRHGLGAVRGATLGPIESSQHPGVGYGTPASAEALDELAALGCNWVSVTPFGRMWSNRDPAVRMDFEAPFAENREAVKRVIAQAHARGMRVLLVPHIWTDTGGWRGEIAFDDPRDWARWFAAYARFVAQWARVAEEAHADMLSVAVEMCSSSGRPEWGGVIDAIRREYSGLLTYSANWDEADRVTFWDRLDVIGVQAFYPLAQHPGASLDELRRAALERADLVERWALREQRPVMFTEFGYTARTDPTLRPWEWPDGMTDVRVDARAQAEGYRALLEAFVPRPWFVGGFVWRYYANPMDSSQEAPWGFSPRGREGEQVLRELYDWRVTWGSDPGDPLWGTQIGRREGGFGRRGLHDLWISEGPALPR